MTRQSCRSLRKVSFHLLTLTWIPSLNRANVVNLNLLFIGIWFQHLPFSSLNCYFILLISPFNLNLHLTFYSFQFHHLIWITISQKGCAPFFAVLCQWYYIILSCVQAIYKFFIIFSLGKFLQVYKSILWKLPKIYANSRVWQPYLDLFTEGKHCQ
jgi:hypothetical protein